MSGAIHFFAAFALVPAMLGASQTPGEHLTLALCSGGAPLAVEIPRDGSPPADEACSKGCHSGCQRKRIDRAQ